MTDADTVARRARAEARRAHMVITRGHLGDDIDPCPVHGEGALALVATVSAAAWSMTGRALPPRWSRPLVIEHRPRDLPPVDR